jgi:hypothetical protein
MLPVASFGSQEWGRSGGDDSVHPETDQLSYGTLPQQPSTQLLPQCCELAPYLALTQSPD